MNDMWIRGQRLRGKFMALEKLTWNKEPEMNDMLGKEKANLNVPPREFQRRAYTSYQTYFTANNCGNRLDAIRKAPGRSNSRTRALTRNLQ